MITDTRRHESEAALPFLRRFDPRVKVVCGLVLVGALLALPLSANRWLWGYAGLILLLAAAGGLEARKLAMRVSILLPFLVLGAALLPLAHPTAPGDELPCAGLVLSRLATATYLSVAGKCLLTLLAAAVLVGTTTSVDLLRALQGLGAPRTITALLGFAVTYLGVLSDEVRRMTRASACRGGRPRPLRALVVAAAMLRTLLVRSFERAERIALAMVARGFAGRMPELRRRRLRAREAVGGLAFVVLALIPHFTGIWS